jgi:hypothetical protein
MKPTYISNYIIDTDKKIFNHLLNDLDWLSVTEARKEFFMAFEKLHYTYGNGINAREYSSSFYSDIVNDIQIKINKEFNTDYNVCFLNRYDNERNALGWHADDSKEMNTEHPICVISFGSEREINWKDKNYKGVIPDTNKKILENGSLFIMPAHFQENNLHKIPKNDKPCGTRISLTFRNYKKL